MGTPAFAVPLLDALANAHEVVAVYCQPPRPAGRGQAPRAGAVEARAAALGLTVRQPRSLRNVEAQAEFAAFGADVTVVAAYGLLLPAAIVTAPRFGCLNAHASLLPRWRGAAPIHRAVLAGDAETGVTVMAMDEGLDTGPTFARAATPIRPADTTGDLHDRLAEMSAALMLDVLAGLPGSPQPQPEDGATYAAKIDKAEARIDWAAPAAEVDRRIRGMAPAPGAWCLAPDGGRLKLLGSRRDDGAGIPGEVLATAPDAIRVACGTGAVAVTLLQREGRQPMRPETLLRGYDLEPGMRLA